MRVRRLEISNFRGVSNGTVDFAGHALLVGGNNVGKSTICEALDLVLGPERLYRKPVVDEHDFHLSKYLDGDGKPTTIRIEVILIELSDEAQLRFHKHLRRWDDVNSTFVDHEGTNPASADAAQTCWALQVLFLGEYDPEEDDFRGDTFFSHPEPIQEEGDEEDTGLGGGRTRFGRDHKRLCGFVFLRALRTGSRALSLQRGSLLDTILRLGAGGLTEMWEDTLTRLRDLDPSIGAIAQLQDVSKEIKDRMKRFVALGPDDDSVSFFASELTREHLRDVVRFFVSAEPCAHPLPFHRLGTGTVNLLVFAFLTFIAELKEKQSVIFAMEEPEIALAPHTQRRVTRFVLREMGQAIVTSHSPYVIEQFEPQQITILERTATGDLHGQPIDITTIKPKTFSKERRQFAEAVLGRAVLVVEGATEAVVFPAASTVLERTHGEAYAHFDLAGVTVFDAGGDGSVPKYGPVFRKLGKAAFCFYDAPKSAPTPMATQQLQEYTQSWQSPETSIEALLIKEIPIDRIRAFLEEVSNRSDYPSGVAKIGPAMADDAVRSLAEKVLIARKGDACAYAALLVECCDDANDLPAAIRIVLESIQTHLSEPPTVVTVAATD